IDFGEGTANIVVQDQFGTPFTYILGNGQNFFTLDAINNEVITDIKIFKSAPAGGNWGFNDLKQPRIGGLCTLVGATCTPIPEPGTIAMFGLGLLGLGLVKARRRRS